jgi:hypothetical protein
MAVDRDVPLGLGGWEDVLGDDGLPEELGGW